MKGEYVPTIGLEIHAELKTQTKMFCDSKNDSEEIRPNVNVCPVCLAHPGVLPVINKEAVRYVLKVGVAVHGALADYTEFDRKNYFYPDLPKGYQLSQFEFPLVSGGELAGVKLTRIHLEEDTASSMHEEGSDTTVIDYNRAGVPLMELVTEPVIHSPEEAGDFARELQLLLRYLGVSEANMEKGEMRVEANVSISKNGSQTLGTKVEIKNLNSFRAMERAVAHEVERQTELLSRGESVAQETRGWDEAKQSTFPQRTKEGSADYRYFPDPDLPSLKLSELSEFSEEALKKDMPELPHERRARYVQFGIKIEDADSFVRDPRLGEFADAVIVRFQGNQKGILLAANYIANDLVNLMRSRAGDTPISVEHFVSIITLILENKISSRGAKDILEAYVAGETTVPEKYAKEKGLIRVTDETAIDSVIERVLHEQGSVVEDYKKGKQAALEYLVGQGMRHLKGAGDPQDLRQRFASAITNSN